MKKIFLLVFLSVSIHAGYTRSPADRTIFQEAETRFRSQDYELALDRYDALISRHPSSPHVPDAQFRRGVTLSRLGRHEEALTALRRVETRFRSTQFLEFVPFWQGMSHYHLGRFNESYQAFSSFLHNREDGELFRQALLFRALSLSELDRSDDAITDLNQLINSLERPEDESFAVALYLSLLVAESRHEDAVEFAQSIDIEGISLTRRAAVALYTAEAMRSVGRLSEAERYFSLVLTSDAEPEFLAPALARLFQKAVREHNEPRMDDLVRSAEQSLASYPLLLSEFRQRAGIESYRAGLRERGESLLLRAWEMRSVVPPEGLVVLYLADAAVARNESARARRFLESFPDYGSTDGDRVLYRLGILELAEQNWAAAGEVFAEYLRRFPDSDRRPEAAYQQAFALYREGRYREAEIQLNRVSALPGVEVPSADIRRLSSAVMRSLDRIGEAIEELSRYLEERPDDIDARFEYVKLLFRVERYEQLIQQVEALRQRDHEIDRLGSEGSFELRYLSGLAHTAGRNYRAALDELGGLAEDISNTSTGLSVMVPYARYYAGWAHYRLAEYTNAIAEFDAMINAFPDHQLAARAAYLAGWSAFSMASYEQAEAFLRAAVPKADSDRQRAEIMFLLGQSLNAAGRRTEALVEFRTVSLEYEDSGLADHAQFEYAGVLQLQGRVDAAAAAYQAVYDRFRESAVAGRALYNRGETYFQAGRYNDARQAFLEYRRAFPSGGLFDAALYWGGLASSRLGEPAGALLLWNQLINDHRESGFRAEAMIQTARIHEERRDFRSALNALTQLIVAYPEQASAVGARRRADELVLLIGGIGEREAALLVRIESGNRAETQQGREAILELGRSTLIEGLGGVNLGLVIPMLLETAAVGERDARAAAEAFSLLGEHARSVGEDLAAAEYFLEAAAMDPSDADRTARSLYRAGEAYRRLGRRTEVVALIQELERSFPDSGWTEQARRVLGGQ